MESEVNNLLSRLLENNDVQCHSDFSEEIQVLIFSRALHGWVKNSHTQIIR